MTTSPELEPRVDVIDPIIDLDDLAPEPTIKKIRVAAYARVSTAQEEQLTSYDNQIDHYTHYIKSNPEWEFVKVYSDEGISGVRLKKRVGFNQMIADAEAGKIDLILVKSISRFARNTVDALTIVRRLKNVGVEVIFEKENLRSLNSHDEVMLTVLSSMAQEESHNTSENVKWTIRKNMKEGKASVAYSHFLGYAKGPDGKWIIVEKEAEIVREIYDLFLKDVTIQNIAKRLTAEGHPTPAGKTVWSVSTVRSILGNEKYKGDALLQKTYTPDFLTKESRKNNGELPQYYASNHHTGIISSEIFDLVQQKLAEKSKNKNRLSNNSPFTTKVICADCGGYFGRKVYHSNDKYRTIAWCCNHKYGNGTPCVTPRIHDDVLKTAFCAALEQILAARKATAGMPGAKEAEEAKRLDSLLKARETASHALQSALQELRDHMLESRRRLDQEEYRSLYESLKAKVSTHKEALQLAEDAIIAHTAKKEKLNRFIVATESLDEKVEYSDELVSTTLERVTVSPVKEGSFCLEFTFVNDETVTVNLSLNAK